MCSESTTCRALIWLQAGGSWKSPPVFFLPSNKEDTVYNYWPSGNVQFRLCSHPGGSFVSQTVLQLRFAVTLSSGVCVSPSTPGTVSHPKAVDAGFQHATGHRGGKVSSPGNPHIHFRCVKRDACCLHTQTLGNLFCRNCVQRLNWRSSETRKSSRCPSPPPVQTGPCCQI